MSVFFLIFNHNTQKKFHFVFNKKKHFITVEDKFVAAAAESHDDEELIHCHSNTLNVPVNSIFYTQT